MHLILFIIHETHMNLKINIIDLARLQRQKLNNI